ncbi:MAG: glycosyltransferase, partial [Zoogloeaceae bacterium]|nr:glycosyltransferase [Zoogloeaceae bacterium]
MSLLRPHEHPEQITGPAPLVSVIVPTMNRPELLAVALESLCQQTFRDFEAVIVNDAGKDPLPAIEPFAQCLDILYISHETNKGLSKSRNTGIRAARGRYITYLDDDDFYYEDHIEALVNTLRQTRAAVVYADANIALQREENGHFATRSRRVLYSVDFDPQRLLRENITPVLCVMHEKRCLEEVGHFRECLKALEDWDLWMRMSRFYTFVHLPFATSEYVWRKGDDTLTQDRQAMRAAGAHLGQIGRWMAQIPRIEELRARLGEAEIVCRAPETACELSV